MINEDHYLVISATQRVYKWVGEWSFAHITDFESTAYAIFLVLPTGAVLHFNLNLYPIFKVRGPIPLFSRD